MPTDRSLASLAAVGAGAILALQSRTNGSLAQYLGTLPAALTSFGSGLLVLSLALGSSGFRQHVGRIAVAVRSGSLPPWQLFGGVAGGLFVGTQAYAVPLVGVATFLVAVVGGQMVSAVVVDHRGIGPAGPVAVSAGRAASAAVAVAGVAITASSTPAGRPLVMLPVLCAFLVGLAATVQAATNGRVTMASRDPFATAWLNFSTGSATVLLLTGVVALTGAGLGAAAVGTAGPVAAPVPAWLWTGGLQGIAAIALSAWAMQHTGVLAFGLSMVTGQLATALVLDASLAATRSRVTAQALAGVLVVVAAAVWSARSARSLDSAP